MLSSLLQLSFVYFTPLPNWHLAGPLVINIHSLAFCLGALAAFFWTYARTPQEYRNHLDSIACWMTFAGILGARLLFLAINLDTVPLSQTFAIWKGGLVSYGGLIGALLAFVLYIKHYKLPMYVFCEALGPAGLLGWGIGRFGCFFSWNNEIGTITDVPWAFIVGADAPRHPVMLYLAVAHCAMALIVAWLAKRTPINAAGLALMAFGVVRLILDVWRDYNPESLLYGSCGVSLFLALCGGLIALTLKQENDTYPDNKDAAVPAECSTSATTTSATTASTTTDDTTK